VYRDGRNIRLQQNDDNTFEVQNVKGDTLTFSFPAFIPGKSGNTYCFEETGAALSYQIGASINFRSVTTNVLTGEVTELVVIVPIGDSPLLADFSISLVRQEIINLITAAYPDIIEGDSYRVDIINNSCSTCLDIYSIKNPVTRNPGSPGSNTIIETYIDEIVISVTGTGVSMTGTTLSIPQVSDFRIVGYGSDDKSLVLFTTSVSAGENKSQVIEPRNPPIPTYGQIWELDISNGGDAIPGLLMPLRQLQVSEHLRYNDDLQLYVSNAFYDEVEVIRESECILRVYWTDNYNPPRTIDIGKGFVVAPTSTLRFNPELKIGKIDFIGLTGDGQMKEGMYRFAYQLIDSTGQAAAISPLTQNLQVFGSPTSDYRRSVGSNIGLPTQFSISVRVENLDGRYQRLRLIAVYFTEAEGIPAQVWAPQEVEIEGRQEVVIKVSDHLERFTPISIEEVVIPRTSITTAKNLRVAADRLFLSNFCETEELDFESSGIGYVARGRYETMGLSAIDSDKTFISFPVDTTHIDFLEYYGHERFTGSSYGAQAETSTENEIINNFIDYKGSDSHYRSKGYWNDERYRFGIVFFLKDGTPQPVKWLTDFDFPSTNLHTTPSDLFAAGNGLFLFDPGFFTPLRLITNYLEISNIDVSAIKDKISGFSIVRARRDPRVIGQALAMPVIRYNVFTPFGGDPQDIAFISTEWFDVTGPLDNIDPGFGNPALPTKNYSRTRTQRYEKTIALYSPEIDFNPSIVNTISQVKLNGWVGYNGNDVPKAVVRSFPHPVSGAIIDFYKLYYRLNVRNSTGIGPNIGDVFNVDSGIYAQQVSTQEAGRCHKAIEFQDALRNRTVDLTGFNDFPSSLPEYLRRLRMGPISRFPNSTINLDTTIERFGFLGSRAVLNLADDFLLPLMGTSVTTPPGLDLAYEGTNAIALVTLYNEKRKEEQYGGQSDLSLANTNYIFCGHFQPVDECNTGDGNYVYSADVFGGDCMPSLYSRYYMNDFIHTHGIDCSNPIRINDNNHASTNPDRNGISESHPLAFIFPIQTSIPLAHRTGVYVNSPTEKDEPLVDAGVRTENFTLANQLWASENHLSSYIAQDPSSCFDCSPHVVIASQRKVYGETRDSFRILQTNERAELEIPRGQIVHTDSLLHVNSDRIYFWQEQGFGFVPINERVAITTSGEAVMGSGQLFGPPVYISRTVGSAHKNSVFRSGKALYWYCHNTKDLFRFAGDGTTNLTEDNGLRSWIRQSNKTGLMSLIDRLDNPMYQGGVHGFYDQENSEAVFAFIKQNHVVTFNPITEQYSLAITEQGSEAICFREGISKFTSYYDQTHGLYMPVFGNRIFATPDPSTFTANDYREHADYKYNAITYLPCSITFIVNKNSMQTKVLSHFMAIMNRLWDKYEVSSNEQQKWNEMAIQHFTDSGFSRFQPRGGKWQGPVALIKSSQELDLSVIPPAIIPHTKYNLGQMRGEYFDVKYLYDGNEFRRLLSVITFFHESSANR
jgi:hypothetical protein